MNTTESSDFARNKSIVVNTADDRDDVQKVRKLNYFIQDVYFDWYKNFAVFVLEKILEVTETLL